MIKIAFLAAFAAVSVTFFVSNAHASGYPPGYCDQVVRVMQDGPALFAHVGSGCDSSEVLGYKLSGVLSENNPESIDAVVTGSCSKDGSTYSKVSTLRLGREWHGQGYLSAPYSYSSFLPNNCYDNSSLSIAFSANGQWDSKFGANYILAGSGGFWNEDPSRVQTLNTGSSGQGNIVIAAWDFIVSKLAD
jgi:hypothetical protein